MEIPEMLETKGYKPNRKLQQLNENIALWRTLKDASKKYDVLTIGRNEKNGELLGVLIETDIKSLINSDIPCIQNVFECWWLDDEKNIAYIVYECLEGYVPLEKDNSNALLYTFEDLLTALDLLYKENKHIKVKEEHIISPDNIFVNNNGHAKLVFVGLFHLFKQEGLLNEDYLPQNVKEYIKDPKKSRPGYQDDIYSAVKSFEPFLRGLKDKNADTVLDKALKDIYYERFDNYSEIIKFVEAIYYKPPFKNTLRIYSKNVDGKHPAFEEMKVKCYMLVENKHGKNNDISVLFSTKNWHGKFYVKKDNKKNDYILVHTTPEPGKHERLDTVGGDWFTAEFSFSFEDDSTNFEAYDFFNRKFENQNQLMDFKKAKEKVVGNWLLLPEKEKTVIKNNELRVEYSKIEFKNGRIDFFLKGSDSVSMDKIDKLIDKKTVLISDDVKIGKIWSYDNNILTLEDICCADNEIPRKGTLIEDTHLETSQYDKQIDACRKFIKGEVTNPKICNIIAIPDKEPMPEHKKLWPEDYENLEVLNTQMKTNKMQIKAVLEALSYEPLYLIQGPPGTGKTTVIVELIHQIIKRNGGAKILVTSQSNIAVDNVLEKIKKINESRKKSEKLLFMRLASKNEGKDKKVVTEPIRPHTNEEELKRWVKETKKKSNEFLHSRFPEEAKHYDMLEESVDEPVTDSKQKPRNGAMEAAMRKSVEKKLGNKFPILKQIQRDWFSFLDNSTDKDDSKKSLLNSGNEEISFLTAMIRKKNIIGATCIHIASSQYKKIHDLKFDYVIMDESSRATPSEALVPINMGKKVVLIGDHKQLPPVVTRDEAVKEEIREHLEDNGLDIQKTFGVSLFENLIQEFENDDDKKEYVTMLNVQYRMPEQIGSIISMYFYDGKLENSNPRADADENKCLGLGSKLDNKPIIFICSSKRKEDRFHNDNDKSKIYNQCNVNMIKEILTHLNKLCVGNLQKENPYTMGIIAGYTGQANLLKRKQTIDLSKYENFVDDVNKRRLIDISTVDGFQGAERDIMIYDVVRSASESRPIGFLDDDRRINVAFSRAKRLLIIVGDSEFLINRAKLNPEGKSKFKEFKLKDIALDLKERGLIVYPKNSIEEVF
jgi:superfamily I DNA and/or RNA helicase